MGSSLHGATRPCKGPDPACASHTYSLLWADPPSLTWGSPQAAGGTLQRHILPHHGLHHGLPGNLWCLEHLLFFFFLLHSPWCQQSCFCHIVLLVSLAEVVHTQFTTHPHPLLDCYTQICHWTLPWPAVGLPWRLLALSLSNGREPSGSFLQKPLLQLPAASTLMCKHYVLHTLPL